MSVTDHASLVAFLEATGAPAVGTLDMEAARTNVQNSMEQEPAKMWQGPFRAREYIEPARLVPTRNVRGMATMFAEIAQAWMVPVGVCRYQGFSKNDVCNFVDSRTKNKTKSVMSKK